MSHPVMQSPLQHAEMIRAAANSSAPVRSTVAASWRRSLLHHNLDPQNPRRTPRLDQTLFRERQDRYEALRRAALPLLDRLAGVALDTGNAVMLADAEGVILEGRVRAADDTVFGLIGLATGADWSEQSEGTNGIGTALVEARPVMIWRDQHFFSRNLPLVCIGAPIEAPDGGPAGVICVSSCREGMNEIQGRLVALTVQDAAVQAAAALFHACFANARIVALPGEPGQGPGLLAVDADDLVIGANRMARRRLDLSPADAARRPPLADLLGETAEAGSDLSRALRSELARALQRAQGNVTAAARELGIGRATFYRKMRSVGLTKRPDRAD